MKGLRVLRVLILDPFHNLRLKEKLKRLEPLMAVKGLDVFEVAWSWKAREGEDPLDLGEVPFRVVNADAFCAQLARERAANIIYHACMIP